MKLQGTPVFEKTWDAINATKEVVVKGVPVVIRLWRIIIGEGSSRSSKTWSYFLIIFLWGATKTRKRIIVLRETAVDCRENVEAEFIDWLEDPMGRLIELDDGKITEEEYERYMEEEDLTQYIFHNKSKHTHTFIDTNSRITFTGGDNVNKIIGKSNDVVWVNEPYKFPEEVMNQLIQRCSDFVLLDWNPKQAHYIDKKLKKKDNALVIHSTYKDNPFCPPEQQKHIEGYLPLSNEFIDTKIKDVHTLKNTTTELFIAHLDKLEIEGEERELLIRAHDNERQATASAWDHSVYALGLKADKPHRIYKHFKKITVAEYNAIEVRPIYVVDWGVVDPFAIIELKYYDGVLYCHELNYMSENELKLSLSTTERLQIDKSNDEGLVLWLFRKKLLIPLNRPVICDNNRKMKIKTLQDGGYDLAGAIRKYPGSILDGIQLVNDIRVCYTETSTNIDNEQENYSRVIHKPTGTVTEEPEDTNNHTLDAIRYGAQHLKEKGVIKGK